MYNNLQNNASGSYSFEQFDTMDGAEVQFGDSVMSIDRQHQQLNTADPYAGIDIEQNNDFSNFDFNYNNSSAGWAGKSSSTSYAGQGNNNFAAFDMATPQSQKLGRTTTSNLDDAFASFDVTTPQAQLLRSSHNNSGKNNLHNTNSFNNTLNSKVPPKKLSRSSLKRSTRTSSQQLMDKAAMFLKKSRQQKPQKKTSAERLSVDSNESGSISPQSHSAAVKAAAAAAAAVAARGTRGMQRSAATTSLHRNVHMKSEIGDESSAEMPSFSSADMSFETSRTGGNRDDRVGNAANSGRGSAVIDADDSFAVDDSQSITHTHRNDDENSNNNQNSNSNSNTQQGGGDDKVTLFNTAALLGDSTDGINTSAETATKFHVGERIEAQYQNSPTQWTTTWYPGKITATAGNDEYDITHDDGDQVTGVPCKRIRSLDNNNRQQQPENDGMDEEEHVPNIMTFSEGGIDALIADGEELVYENPKHQQMQDGTATLSPGDAGERSPSSHSTTTEQQPSKPLDVQEEEDEIEEHAQKPKLLSFADIGFDGLVADEVPVPDAKQTATTTATATVAQHRVGDAIEAQYENATGEWTTEWYSGVITDISGVLHSIRYDDGDAGNVPVGRIRSKSKAADEQQEHPSQQLTEPTADAQQQQQQPIRSCDSPAATVADPAPTTTTTSTAAATTTTAEQEPQQQHARPDPNPGGWIVAAGDRRLVND